MKEILILISILIVCMLVTPEVFAANITEAKEAIDNAEKIVQEMAESNFSTVFVNDTLLRAKEDFKKKNYDSVLEKTRTIETRKEKAYEISDSLNSIEVRIEELTEMNLDTSEIREILDDAKREFRYENYDEADRLISKAFDEISDTEAKQTILKARYEAAKNRVITFFANYKEYVIITNIISIILCFIVFKIVNGIRIKNELRSLRLEKNVTEDLIKETQKNRYQRDAISKKAYQLTMSKYKSRIREIEKRILVLEKKIKKKI